MGKPVADSAEETAFFDLLLRAVLTIVLIGRAAAGTTDTDIWGHMAIGLDTLQGGRFLWSDPYSFASDQAWVNHEWLWDVLLAAVYRTAGLPGVVVVRAGLITVAFGAVHRATRRAPPWIRVVTIVLVALGCIGQWRSTRPQIASIALYAIVLPNISAWWLPALFAAWVNLHGGWMIGFGAVLAHAALRRTVRDAGIALACTAATLANPYGGHLWLALGEAMWRGWSDVTEWAPVWVMAAGRDAAVLWIVLAAAASVLWFRAPRDPWRWVWTAVTFAAAANSRRLMAFAALTPALLLVPTWQPAALPPRVAWTLRRWRIAGVSLGIAVLVGWQFVQPTLTCFPPVPGWRAPESDAVAFLRAANVERVVPHFDYGEYAIFHLRDRTRVSIDNRRETVYSDAAIKASDRFAAGEDPDYPARLRADAVWWPANETAVIQQLETRGWYKRFEGPRTVVLLRTDGPLVQGVSRAGTPCFPNP